ncbi:carbonic anhydrase [Oculatella sp. LEGE 06141]|uniref:carbonic anhydrase n=1 Tax=Oculatella sp. LEGE 06141 TaxID=1828648 RepID=UPI001882E464|nr:carbonic anhydrase [Oculatella sp. LEGE 06141]MBE9177611.1 carbonic anhydrase [Oculatella sp. LEGE 06141]
MKKLLKGLREFKTSYFATHQALFEELSHAQRPRVLFITCSDSRIDPNLITQAGLGELFVIRNAGNIIPPYGATNGGEGATIEYAVHALDIQHIIVCGHSHCGAIKGLLKLEKLEDEMPLVHDWLKYAESTRRLVKDNYGTYSGEELLEVAVAENVLTQIENLRTYPVVHSKIYRKQLHLYAWVYMIETGEVFAYDPVSHSYMLPQSQLPELAKDESLTNMFPACDALIKDADDEEIEEVIVHEVANSHKHRSQEATAQTYHRSEELVVPGNRRIPTTPLSPEQQDRIYRGSAAR